MFWYVIHKNNTISTKMKIRLWGGWDGNEGQPYWEIKHVTQAWEATPGWIKIKIRSDLFEGCRFDYRNKKVRLIQRRNFTNHFTLRVIKKH